MEVLAIFRTEKNRQIVGGKVISGEVKRGVKIDVLRNGEKIGKGKLIQLQQNKKEVDKVSQEQECGILFEGDVKIQEGDALEFYEEERTKHAV
jgi:translation initiation factor IF-2